MNNAIGLVEVMGLAGAVDVSDVMLKAANVQLIGVERAKGFGWMTVKIEGDVGAVKAAVDAGKAQAVTNNVYVSDLVIPRPATNLGEVFFQKDQKLVGAEPVGESLAEANKTDETFVKKAPAAAEEKVEVKPEAKVEVEAKPAVKAAPEAKKPTPAKETPAAKKPAPKPAAKPASAKTEAPAKPAETQPAAKKPAASSRRKTTRRTRKTNANDSTENK